MKPKEAEEGCPQYTFTGVDLEPVVLETGENLTEMTLVLLCGDTGDQNVIQVGVREEKTMKDLIHEPLKGLCGVPQAEGHLQELKMSKGCCDGGLRDILRGDRDLVIGPNQINLRKDGAAM